MTYRLCSYNIFSYNISSHNTTSHDIRSYNTPSHDIRSYNTPSHNTPSYPLTTLSVHPGTFPCFSLLSMQWFCVGVLNKLGRLSTHQILDCADELGAAVNLLQFMVLRILACTNDTPSDEMPSDEASSGPTSVLRSFLGLSSSSSSTTTSNSLASQINNRIHGVFETLGELIGLSTPFN